MTRMIMKDSSLPLIVIIALVEKVEAKEVSAKRLEKVKENDKMVFTLSTLIRGLADAAPTVAENIQPTSARMQLWTETSVRAGHATKWAIWVQAVL